MKYIAILAALLLSSNASAATYVYQQNANQGHSGRCGGELLPFQMTLTVHRPFPPNSNLNVPIKTIYLNAGGKYRWGERNTKKHQLGGIFVTDANGDITGWSVAGGYRHSQAWTINQPGTVQDIAEFGCGSEGSESNPGTWTRG